MGFLGGFALGYVPGCLNPVRLSRSDISKYMCIIVIEGEEVTADPEDMLDKQKCLDALAAVRRVKWFHVCCFSILT